MFGNKNVGKNEIATCFREREESEQKYYKGILIKIEEFKKFEMFKW